MSSHSHIQMQQMPDVLNIAEYLKLGLDNPVQKRHAER